MKLLKNTQNMDLGQILISEFPQVNPYQNQPFQPFKIYFDKKEDLRRRRLWWFSILSLKKVPNFTCQKGAKNQLFNFFRLFFE